MYNTGGLHLVKTKISYNIKIQTQMQIQIQIRKRHKFTKGGGGSCAEVCMRPPTHPPTSSFSFSTKSPTVNWATHMDQGLRLKALYLTFSKHIFIHEGVECFIPDKFLLVLILVSSIFSLIGTGLEKILE